MRPADNLSARQKDILNYIEDFMTRRGFPPAIRQIQETLGISSTSIVAYNLKVLEGKGMLKREGKVSRGVTFPQAPPTRLSRFELLVRRVSRLFARDRLRQTSKVAEEADDHRPPQFAEYLLYFLPKKDREPILGDLEEEYCTIFQRFGRRKAVVWYYFQVIASFWPYIKRAASKLVKWGALGWLSNLARRLI